MYATIRRYKVDQAAVDLLVRRRGEVEGLIKTAPGFLAYYLVKTSDGMASITVCEDESGTTESNRLAAGWVKENMAALVPNPPEITAGEVVVQTAR